MYRFRDWKCPKCGSVSPDVPVDVPDQWCPWCGAEMKKVWSSIPVVFNGSGWTPKYF